MYVCACVCTHRCTHTQTHMCMCFSPNLSLRQPLSVCMEKVNLCMCIYICVYVYVYICIYIYSYVYIYIYIHIYTYMYKCIYLCLYIAPLFKKVLCTDLRVENVERSCFHEIVQLPTIAPFPLEDLFVGEVQKLPQHPHPNLEIWSYVSHKRGEGGVEHFFASNFSFCRVPSPTLGTSY